MTRCRPQPPILRPIDDPPLQWPDGSRKGRWVTANAIVTAYRSPTVANLWRATWAALAARGKLGISIVD